MVDIADFVVGEEVEFEVLEDDRPRYNMGIDRSRINSIRCVPPKYVKGKVTLLACGLYDVQYPSRGYMSVWTWKQPSTDQGAYKQEGYLRRVGCAKNVTIITARNNDGQDKCLWCGNETRRCGGFRYDIDYRVCKKCGR